MDGITKDFQIGETVNDRNGNVGEVIAAFVDGLGNRRVRFADGLDTYEAPARLVSFYGAGLIDDDCMPTDDERAVLDAEIDEQEANPNALGVIEYSKVIDEPKQYRRVWP